MIELNDRQILPILARLRKEYGSLQVAHVALAQRAGAADSINGLAAVVGCSRGAVRRALEKLGQNLSETDS